MNLGPLVLLAGALVLSFGALFPPDQPTQQFREVSARAGVTPLVISGSRAKDYVLEVNGSGVCWFDYNNDGYMDLYVVNGSTVEELRGTPACSETQQSPVPQ